MINTADLPYILYYSTDIKTTNVNYQTETADLRIVVDLGKNPAWFKTMNKTIQAAQMVLDGLNATNRKKDWGLAGWPKDGQSNANPFTVWKNDIAVVFELVNQKGRVIGSQTIKLNPEIVIDGSSNGKFAIGFTGAGGSVNFNGVKADDLSDNLTIRVASVNGVPPQNARFTITAMPLEKFVDKRDGKEYNIVRIGGSAWMARNLDYRPSSGNSWCYKNSDSNCVKYGRLYDWNTAKTVCPVGWHLPTRQEFGKLVKVAGGTGEYGAGGTAGTRLKSTTGWNSIQGNGNGTDNYGFAALPGGYYANGSFYHAVDKHGFWRGRWWAATERDASFAYYRLMGYGSDYVDEGWDDKSFGFSVRCLGD
jgi:uncharacterized protein (TIGR02145 family)